MNEHVVQLVKTRIVLHGAKPAKSWSKSEKEMVRSVFVHRIRSARFGFAANLLDRLTGNT